MCKITLLFLSGFLKLQVLSLVIVLACWAVAASRVGKGLVSGQFNKVNVPVLRRDLSRIDEGGSAWDMSAQRQHQGGFDTWQRSQYHARKASQTGMACIGVHPTQDIQGQCDSCCLFCHIADSMLRRETS
eukprot:1156718-Pelagomonas_calceolata.AAC.4